MENYKGKDILAYAANFDKEFLHGTSLADYLKMHTAGCASVWMSIKIAIITISFSDLIIEFLNDYKKIRVSVISLIIMTVVYWLPQTRCFVHSLILSVEYVHIISQVQLIFIALLFLTIAVLQLWGENIQRIFIVNEFLCILPLVKSITSLPSFRLHSPIKTVITKLYQYVSDGPMFIYMLITLFLVIYVNNCTFGIDKIHRFIKDSTLYETRGFARKLSSLIMIIFSVIGGLVSIVYAMIFVIPLLTTFTETEAMKPYFYIIHGVVLCWELLQIVVLINLIGFYTMSDLAVTDWPSFIR